MYLQMAITIRMKNSGLMCTVGPSMQLRPLINTAGIDLTKQANLIWLNFSFSEKKKTDHFVIQVGRDDVFVCVSSTV